MNILLIDTTTADLTVAIISDKVYDFSQRECGTHHSEKLCDRVVIINRGNIVKTLSEDDLKEISATSSLEDYFLALTSGECIPELSKSGE